MPILESDGHKVSYEEYGAGPVVVLLHGSPGNAQAWAQVGTRLAARYRVVVPNLPGYGETSPQPPGEEPDVGYASLLMEMVMRQVGHAAVLAGYSYGGVVALAIALRGNVAIGTLALFEPVALPLLLLGGEYDSFREAQAIFHAYIASFTAGNPRAIQYMFDFWFGAGAFARLPESVASALMQVTATNVQDVRAAFRVCYTPESLRQLTMPVVTTVGERSLALMHHIAHIITAHVPLGSRRQIAHANHALTTTHADAVAQIIAEMPTLVAGDAGKGLL